MAPTIATEYEQRCRIDSDIQGHLPFLFQCAEQSKVLLELGVRSGNSTAALLAGCEAGGGRLWSVDIVPPGIPQSWYDHPQWRFRLADDTDKTLLDWVPWELDLLFVDTDHRYEHTLVELDLYGTRVKSGGVILLHDVDLEVSPDGIDTGFPVRRAMQDWCRRRFLTPTWREGFYGLGVIEVT